MKSSTYGTSLHYEGESGERYFDWQNTHGPLRGRINARKFSGIRPDDVVVDFGCGGGHLLAALEASRRIGIEVNPAARREAEQRGIETYPDVTSVEEAVADVVVSNHALEHVPYPIEALRQLRRVLKPGGSLILVVPIDDWRAQRRWEEHDINNHLQTWTPLLLGNSLREAGFAVRRDSISVLTHGWPPGWDKLFGMSPAAFDVIGRLWAVLRRRRQLVASVQPSAEVTTGREEIARAPAGS